MENRNSIYLKRRIGNTTYKVRAFFNDDAAAGTMQDKILNLIRIDADFEGDDGWGATLDGDQDGTVYATDDTLYFYVDNESRGDIYTWTGRENAPDDVDFEGDEVAYVVAHQVNSDHYLVADVIVIEDHTADSTAQFVFDINETTSGARLWTESLGVTGGEVDTFYTTNLTAVAESTYSVEGLDFYFAQGRTLQLVSSTTAGYTGYGIYATTCLVGYSVNSRNYVEFEAYADEDDADAWFYTYDVPIYVVTGNEDDGYSVSTTTRVFEGDELILVVNTSDIDEILYVIDVTQSGTTRDTTAAVRLARLWTAIAATQVVDDTEDDTTTVADPITVTVNETDGDGNYVTLTVYETAVTGVYNTESDATGTSYLYDGDLADDAETFLMTLSGSTLSIATTSINLENSASTSNVQTKSVCLDIDGDMINADGSEIESLGSATAYQMSGNVNVLTGSVVIIDDVAYLKWSSTYFTLTDANVDFVYNRVSESGTYDYSDNTIVTHASYQFTYGGLFYVVLTD